MHFKDFGATPGLLKSVIGRENSGKEGERKEENTFANPGLAVSEIESGRAGQKSIRGKSKKKTYHSTQKCGAQIS